MYGEDRRYLEVAVEDGDGVVAAKENETHYLVYIGWNTLSILAEWRNRVVCGPKLRQNAILPGDLIDGTTQGIVYGER